MKKQQVEKAITLEWKPSRKEANNGHHKLSKENTCKDEDKPSCENTVTDEEDEVLDESRGVGVKEDEAGKGKNPSNNLNIKHGTTWGFESLRLSQYWKNCL